MDKNQKKKNIKPLNGFCLNFRFRQQEKLTKFYQISKKVFKLKDYTKADQKSNQKNYKFSLLLLQKS